MIDRKVLNLNTLNTHSEAPIGKSPGQLREP
jgi:hypothetical protein